MSKQAKTSHPIGRAVLAITALGVIVVSANLLVSSLGVGHKNVDFTENKVHTLSDGTRGILKELGTPVTIRYYATRSSDYMPEELKLHMRRVDDLLAEYVNLSNGKLRVEQLDPEPDTDAEDAANLDGIRGQRFDDQNLYFGLAVSCIDATATIPFLDPSQETMLEYEISKAIAEVSRTSKPVVGLMSGLPITGEQANPMAMMQGQQGSPPWVIYSQLAQSYEVKDLTLAPEKIDPSIAVLLVFHPAGITPEAEFAIDQYLLQGGTVIACLDPYSAAAGGGGNPMMGGSNNSSTFPTLLPAWGVTLNSQILADPIYAAPGGAPPFIVQPTGDAIPQKNDVVTKQLNSMVFYMPGGFSKTGTSGVSATSLVRSSNKAAFIDSAQTRLYNGQGVPPALKPTGSTYDLVLRLSGSFKSAFPKGKPGTEEPKPEEKKDEPKDEKKEEKPAHLVEATKPGDVFLIADVDAFHDQIAYNVQRLGQMQMAAPRNGNSSLLFNILDQAASSGHLIGSRSRAAIARPFTKIKELEEESKKRIGGESEKLEEKAKAAQTKLNELQAERSSSDGSLTPEQKALIRKYEEERIAAEREKRELEKDLRREKDKIAGRATFNNVAIMPGLVILLGLGLFIKRRITTGAR
jgi:ABC-type uncharacterized transport system involved in gliding motility auxiliary subunit